MIPLGSCTMKLNAAVEMLPVSWPEFSRIHPFAPLRQTRGYQTLFQQLEDWLAEITGFAGISLQPNAGSQGELADLRAKSEAHKNDLAALMVTYPSTHGVFEESIREVCEAIYTNGGQVYMDGA